MSDTSKYEFTARRTELNRLAAFLRSMDEAMASDSACEVDHLSDWLVAVQRELSAVTAERDATKKALGMTGPACDGMSVSEYAEIVVAQRQELALALNKAEAERDADRETLAHQYAALKTKHDALQTLLDRASVFFSTYIKYTEVDQFHNREKAWAMLREMTNKVDNAEQLTRGTMTKQEFKKRWDSGPDGGGITFDDIADCAQAWGLYSQPRTAPLDKVMYDVLKAANVRNVEQHRPGDSSFP